MTAKYRIQNGFAIISISNPPTNALNYSTRRAILQCIEKANIDPTVSGIIICGDGKAFSSGADINELVKYKSSRFPAIIDVVERLESSSKPTIAAIHNFAYGGGLELALGCHYRVAEAEARFALPEVKIGILPGAGGTQRLPRVIPIDQALKWFIYGKENSAIVSHAYGLIDVLTTGKHTLINEAIGLLKNRQNENLNERRISLLPIKNPESTGAIDTISKSLTEKYRGATAPNICFHAVTFGCAMPYRQGLLHEKTCAKLLANSDQSRAMIHLFFAQRVCNQWQMPGMNYSGVTPQDVKSFAVIGLGTMGRGIALSLLRKAFPVYVLEDTKDALQIGVTYIKDTLDRMMKRKQLTSDQGIFLKSCIRPTSNYNDLKDVDMVVECVFEDLELKKEIFSKLDKVCKQSAILASNTSALDIDDLASATSRPHKVLGMHFFSPAHLMPLLENVYGDKTSPVTVATAMTIGKEIGKTPVLVGNCRGFVGNRMYDLYMSGSDYLLEEGAYPEEVDEALRMYGFAMGRYQVGDLAGNDVTYRVRQSVGLTAKQQPNTTPENSRNGKRYCPLCDYLVESGRYGYKSNLKGWFDYKLPELEPIPSPIVKKMIDDYRGRIGVVPRKIHPEEIIERMLYPMINEGFRILEEGIAIRPSDIDVVWLNGYSWPRHTGGPMFYAHTVGLPHVLEVVKKYWNKSNFNEDRWRPSRLLRHLVENYGNPHINDWMKLTELEVSMWKSSL